MLTIPFIVIVTCVCVKQSYKEKNECSLSFFLLIALLDTDTCHKEENECDLFIPPKLLHPSQLS